MGNKTEIKSELLFELDNIQIKKQSNNFEYGNGYELYVDGKFRGAWDTFEQMFNLSM